MKYQAAELVMMVEKIAIFGGVISNPGFGYNDGDTLSIDGGAEGNLIITNGNNRSQHY